MKTTNTIFVSFFALVCSLILSIGCSEENNPAEPVGIKNSDIKVLILKDGGTEDTVYSVLFKAGFDVTVGEFFYNFDGRFIDGYNLVIFLNGVNYNNDISDSVQQRLKNYVRDGGTLLTTEWMTFSTNYYQILREILPSMFNGVMIMEPRLIQKKLIIR